MTDTNRIRHHVHRPPASATWEHEHKWGTLISDSTTLRVRRTAGRGLHVDYGKDSVEIRGELVEIFARMVAEAATWTGLAD